MEKKARNYLKVRKSDWKIFLGLFLYRVLIDYVYLGYVSKQFAYYHFNSDIDGLYIILSYFALSMVIWCIPKLFRNGRVSDLVLGLMIMFYYIPYTSLFAYSLHDTSYAAFVVGYFLLMIFFNNRIRVGNLRFKGSKTGYGDTAIFVILIVGFGLLRIVASGIYTGFRIAFDLSDYYEYRAEAREFAMPEIIRYLLGWSTTALTIGLIYSIITKKKILSIFIIICTILDFSFNGKKAILFLMVLTIVIGIFFREKLLPKIPYAFTALGAAGALELFILGSDSFICRHFVRRLLFIPPNMSILHYEYFSVHEFDYLRLSVLRRFGFVSPYASYKSIPRLIGSEYFSRQSMAMNANTGLCGDAFANFGFWSILFAPLVIILTFKLIEICSQNTDRRVQLVVALFVAYSFINGSYFTLLLTNGILFLMVLLVFLNGRKEEPSDYDAVAARKYFSGVMDHD